MFPLSEPEFEDSSEASQGLIEARIRLCVKQRDHALRHDVKEADDSGDLDGQKEIPARHEPINNISG